TVYQRISVDIQLSGSLGNIEAVLEEFIDGQQRLLIEIIRRLVGKNLFDKHFTQRNGKLIDQQSDSQCTVCEHIPVAEENLAHVQSGPRFLVGTGHFL